MTERRASNERTTTFALLVGFAIVVALSIFTVLVPELSNDRQEVDTPSPSTEERDSES